MDKDSLSVLLCRQEAGVECGGEVLQMSVLYDRGAPASMVTHQAAERAGLRPIPREEREVSGLNGAKSHPNVPTWYLW
jgi:hypothetical protein